MEEIQRGSDIGGRKLPGAEDSPTVANVAEDPMTNGVAFPPVCPPKNPDVPPVVNTPPRIFSPCQNGR